MFYQNPFPTEFRGSLLLGDRQFNMTFVVPANKGRGLEVITSHVESPYNLSGNDPRGGGYPISTLKLYYSLDAGDFKNWNLITVTAIGASAASVTADTIVANLNADTGFASLFTAFTSGGTPVGSSTLLGGPSGTTGGGRYVLIKQNLPATRMRFYIATGNIEHVLQCNKFAGIANIPSYFDRHTVIGNAANRYYTANTTIYSDSLNTLIYLDANATLTQNVITNCVNPTGLKYADVGASTADATDYKLLKGCSGIFNFQKITQAAGNITQIIEYPAGATVGDLARKINYLYTTGTKPDQITEVPHILIAADLVTP